MSLSEYLDRELSTAQMIVASPLGVWPQTLIALSRRVLRKHAGWNVTPLHNDETTTHGPHADISACGGGA